MMKWKMMGLALAMSGALTGCGIGLEDAGGPDVAREIKNEKLRGEYDLVRGTYEGELRLSGSERVFPIRLFVWIGEVQEAPMPGDLKPGTRVVLRGRMMQTEVLGDSDNLIMTGQFDALTGLIRLDPDLEISKTSSGCTLGGQDPISIISYLRNGEVTGRVLRNGQEWAQISNLKRVSDDTATGAVISEEQEYRRLLEVYKPVTGMYSGELSRTVCGNSTRKENYSLWLYVERVVVAGAGSGGACRIPRLVLRTLRNFSGDWADVSYRSLNRFDPDNFLPQFASVTTSFGTNATVNMDLVDGRLKGDIMTTGLWGQFDLARVSERVVAPEDETLLWRSRLERTFALFTGVYRGFNKPKDGAPWPVDLTLYVDEQAVDGVRLPVLKALYRRPNMSDDTIGSRLMDVSLSIDGCRSSLFMRSEPTGIGPIPGVGLMRYSATYENGKMTGELIDHRGPQGILTVDKK